MKELIFLVLNGIGKGFYFSILYAFELYWFIPKIKWYFEKDGWSIVLLWFIFGRRLSRNRNGLAIGLTFLFFEIGGYSETENY